MNLAELKPGQSGIIQSIDDSDPFLSRLAELGFVPGESVSVLRRAPLGDPLEVRVMDSSMCIRAEQARRILMQES
ncbi:MAG: ferrous iron transport protein A [Leptospiraceae bacterium]|nr:ferrous iron transport protein A [Leptospiraceae bacterium]MCB1304262.1 ferrous iron transport protein A [Leptospiraceae bacterium]